MAKQATRTMTSEFRVIWPSLFEPKENSFDEEKEPRYELTMLFPKAESGEQPSELVNILKSAAEGKWGKKIPKFRYPVIKDGDDSDNEKYEGYWVVKADSLDAPGVLDRQKREITNPRDIYPGCWCRAILSAYAYDYKGMTKGVKLELNHVQFVRDDDRLDGRPPRTNAEDEFEALDEPEAETAAAEFTEF